MVPIFCSSQCCWICWVSCIGKIPAIEALPYIHKAIIAPWANIWNNHPSSTPQLEPCTIDKGPGLWPPCWLNEPKRTPVTCIVAIIIWQI